MAETEKRGKIDLDVKFAKAVRLHQDGQLLKAGNIYQEILDQYPDNADTLHLAGFLAHQTGDNKGAVALITKAIHTSEHNPHYHNSLGLALMALGKQEKAIASYRKAISVHSLHADAHYNLGAVMQLQNKFDEALGCFRKALEIQPDLCEAYASIGIVLHTQGKSEKAAESFRKAIEIRPQDDELYHHLGRVLEDLGKFDDAIDCYRRILEIQPRHAEAYNDMGLVLRDQGKFAEALASLQKAVEIDPECGEAHNNLGNLLQDGGRLEAASKCYHQALAIQPGFAKSYSNLGMVCQGMGKSEEAVTCFRRAIENDPEYASAYRHLVHQLQKDCSWSQMEAPAAKLDRLTKASLEAGVRPAEDPFIYLTRHQDPASNSAVARAWAADVSRRMADVKTGFSFDDRPCRSRIITIGYISNNFHDHPMAHLSLGLFSLYDRNQFKIHCYSCGQEDDSYYRQRIRRDCDKFVDIRDMSHLEAARAIYDDRVDILVDLMGHTKGSRMEICALRPAPIQVRYLGLAGTTDTGFFDYLLTDKIVTPEAHAIHYSGSLVYLPHCYQINAYKQTYGDKIAVTGDVSLPANPFIFCSFNQDYKIEPVMFDCWMKILRRVPKSVLWLMVPHQAAVENLRKEAQKRGVDPNRLVFMEKKAKAEHLERLTKAGLALDTRIVNGAATTSDALWAGVPVITLKGSHFASRMSASILTAIGLPELIAHSIEEYEAIAVQTALDHDQLEGLRQKLAQNRLTKPLFDTVRFAHNLEQAYKQMWQNFQSGLKACQFDVLESDWTGNQGPELEQNISLQAQEKNSQTPTAEPRSRGRSENSIARGRGILPPTKPESSGIAANHPQPFSKKIALFCGPNDSFLGDIYNYLTRKYEIRKFEGKTVPDMYELMKWSDVSWFEWCDKLVIEASRLPKVCGMICRIHRYEVFTEMLEQVDWKKIDDLIFVVHHIRDIAMGLLPDLEQNVRTHIIHNGVDADKYCFSERSHGYNIAYIGYIHSRKNPSLLLQCLRYLVEIDDRYMLHIAGEHQDVVFRLYFDHMIKAMELEHNVKFYGWVDDIGRWLQDKHYILSTSIHESFGYGIAEAMACGLKPLIHNFFCANEIYPAKYCFNSIKEFGDMVLSSDYRSNEYRKYIEDNYSNTKQFQGIENLLAARLMETGRSIRYMPPPGVLKTEKDKVAEKRKIEKLL